MHDAGDERNDRLRESLPKMTQLFTPVLMALKELGGSARNEELVESVVTDLNLTEEQQEVPRKDGRVPQIVQSITEARTRLRKLGYVDQSERGVWALTDAGERASPEELSDVNARYAKILAEERLGRAPEESDADAEVEDDETLEEELTWQQALVERLLALSPDQFERLAQRLLREASFTDVRVTGRRGDGGIDGVGVYRLGLLSFHVYWQSKRWKGAVGASEVRNFRGAMAGRGDKGLLITTGTFTVDAQRESTRDGAPPIDLISGNDLAELMKEYGLGMAVKVRQEEDISFTDDFFSGL